jgi:hypothetical protein
MLRRANTPLPTGVSAMLRRREWAAVSVASERRLSVGIGGLAGRADGRPEL